LWKVINKRGNGKCEESIVAYLKLFLRTLLKERRRFRKIPVAGTSIRGGIQTSTLQELK